MRRAIRIALTASAFAASGLGPASRAWAGTYAHITVDGDVSDWNGIAPVYTDPSDNTTQNGSGQVVDFKSIYVANDDNYVYLRVTLYQPANPSTFYTNLFIDGDGNKNTGFGKISDGYAAAYAAEALIQGNGVFQEAGGGFNEGTLGVKDNTSDGTGFQMATFDAVGTDQFEYRLSRSATLKYSGANGVDYAGQKLFTGNLFNLTFETDPGPADLAGPVSYTFADAPQAAPEPGVVTLTALAVSPLLTRRRRPRSPSSHS